MGESFTELYREPGAMQTHPAVFATLEEQLVFLRAMLDRGTYKSTTPHDE